VCLSSASAIARVGVGREAVLLVLSAPAVSSSEQGAYRNGTSPTNAEWTDEISYAGQSFANSTDGRYVATAISIGALIE
jgi:hypothetical protein